MSQFDPCHICATPAQHHVCDTCLASLMTNMVNLFDQFHDLNNVVLTKQTHYGNPGERIRKTKDIEMPLPLNLAASDHLAHSRLVLNTACKLLDNQLDINNESLNTLLALIITDLDRVQTMASGPELYTTLEQLAKTTSQLVDKPRQKQFIGPCASCKQDVRVDGDTVIGDYVTCETCGTSFDYRLLRQRRLRKAESEMWTMLEVERLSLQLFGRKVHRRQIWRWVKRGRVKNVGEGDTARVRVGDVAAMVQYGEEAQKPQAS